MSRVHRRCDESVRQQEGVTIEHTVQDAGSEDETIYILRSHEGQLRGFSEPDRGIPTR